MSIKTDVYFTYLRHIYLRCLVAYSHFRDRQRDPELVRNICLTQR